MGDVRPPSGHLRSVAEILTEMRSKRLVDGQLETRATELLAHPLSEVARSIFQIVRSAPSEQLLDNLIPVLRVLAERDSKWATAIEKSTKKRGRCPRALRAAFLSALSSPGTVSGPSTTSPLFEMGTEEASSAKPASPLAVRSARTAKLHLTTHATSMRGLDQLLTSLARLGSPARLILDLSKVDHVYIVGLAILALWCKQRSMRVSLERVSHETRAYLDSVRFIDFIEGRCEYIDVAEHGQRLALHPLRPSVRVEELATTLSAIVDKHALLSESDHSGLTVSFGELMENVQRHAGQNCSAVAAAQFYPRKRKLTIVVADSGMGLETSMREGWNDSLAGRLTRESPLALAMAPLVTSKPVRPQSKVGHAGYGLYVASELCVRNGGTFCIASGRDSATVYRRTDARGWRRRRYMSSHGNWQGTIVVMLLDCENTVPLAEVYRSLPPTAGMEEEDFFS